MSSVPEIRLRRVNQAPVEPKGGFVLYWMTAARRTERNFGLQRAVEWAVDLKKPIVVLEALRCGYPRASDRLHRFIMDGMLDDMARCRGKPVLYYPYLERAYGEGRGLLEGRIQNYLRMIWGKKILEWSPSPRQALTIMLGLNDKYALDGRDPNSCSGIFWTLGRYDRPWAPERPIFGKIRYMSSRNTARKLRLRKYLESYGE